MGGKNINKKLDCILGPKAVVYYSNDDYEVVYPKDGKKFTLKELQDLVGGWIETATLNDGRIMVLNEEGKLMGFPRNNRATQIYHDFMYKGDFIVGTAVVSDPELID